MNLATLQPPATPPADPASPAKRPARGKRRALSAKLKRLDVIHDVPETERTCLCGTPTIKIASDISEQRDILPMQ